MLYFQEVMFNYAYDRPEDVCSEMGKLIPAASIQVDTLHVNKCLGNTFQNVDNDTNNIHRECFNVSSFAFLYPFLLYLVFRKTSRDLTETACQT